MHEIQQKLLRLTKDKNLGQYTLREIGSFIGEKSPQKIKHHLEQLEKRGLIMVNKGKGLIAKASANGASSFLKNAKLLAIPILGSANAGPAQMFAEANVEGYLRVSEVSRERIEDLDGAHRRFDVSGGGLTGTGHRASLLPLIARYPV